MIFGLLSQPGHKNNLQAVGNKYITSGFFRYHSPQNQLISPKVCLVKKSGKPTGTCPLTYKQNPLMYTLPGKKNTYFT